jgi:CheY-like chemotaxis protein
VEGRRARVTVADTGIGIEPRMLGQLFNAFTQADSSLERGQGGLGLGLALVKGLAELHGGDVTARSEGVGRGAEFSLTLPLAGQAADPSDPPPAGEARPTLPRLRVLVIEDNVDAADSVRMLLELFGHEVTLAHSGTEGVEAARRLRPDLILCDIGLPGMSGFEVARTLRQDERLARVKLVAVSGYGQEEDHQQALEAGFDRALVKPVSPDALRRLLAGMM